MSIRGTSTNRLRARRTSGMSLVEVMVAMVILAFGMLGVAALQVRAITEGSGGQHLSDASSLARNRVEELNRLVWTDPLLTDTAGAWTVATTMNGFDVPYLRQERITDDSPVAASVRTKTIEVRVGWGDEKRQNRRVLLSTARLREMDEMP